MASTLQQTAARKTAAERVIDELNHLTDAERAEQIAAYRDGTPAENAARADAAWQEEARRIAALLRRAA
jgi:hypothetical protein